MRPFFVRTSMFMLELKCWSKIVPMYLAYEECFSATPFSTGCEKLSALRFVVNWPRFAELTPRLLSRVQTDSWTLGLEQLKQIYHFSARLRYRYMRLPLFLVGRNSQVHFIDWFQQKRERVPSCGVPLLTEFLMELSSSYGLSYFSAFY